MGLGEIFLCWSEHLQHTRPVLTSLNLLFTSYQRVPQHRHTNILGLQLQRHLPSPHHQALLLMLLLLLSHPLYPPAPTTKRRCQWWVWSKLQLKEIETSDPFGSEYQYFKQLLLICNCCPGYSRPPRRHLPLLHPIKEGGTAANPWCHLAAK